MLRCLQPSARKRGLNTEHKPIKIQTYNLTPASPPSAGMFCIVIYCFGIQIYINPNYVVC